MSQFIEVVPFHGNGIATIREGDAVLVVMKPLVETLGLAWHGQFERLNRHPIFSEGIRVTRIPSTHGVQETVALDLKMLPGYLATIQSERIKDAQIRDRVVLFQREAFDVLFQHFFGGRGPVGRQAVVATASEAIKLIDAIKRATLPAERDYLHAMLAQLSEVRGLPCPPVNELVEPDHRLEQAIEFLAKIEALIADGSLTNHHRREDRLAFSMRDLRGIAYGVNRDLMAVLKQHPRFLANCPVNCRDGRNRHCWVFLAA